jgi:hypothetical protein
MIVFGAGGVAVVMAMVVFMIMTVFVVVTVLVSMLMAADFQHIVGMVMAVVMAAIGPVNVAGLAVGRIGRSLLIGRLMMGSLMIMGVTMIMAVIVSMPAMIIGPALRPEGAGDLGDRAALAADHLGQHMIVFDVKRVSGDFGRGMAVADVPGDAHQPERVLSPDFEQRLSRCMNHDKAAILELQRIAFVNDRGLVEIKQEFGSIHGFQYRAATLPVLVGEHDSARHSGRLDGSFADNGDGTLHGNDPRT